MTDDMRERIKTTIKVELKNLAEYENKYEAYMRCLAFVRGIQFGSQDAQLMNFTNRLLEEYRLKLICEKTA